MSIFLLFVVLVVLALFVFGLFSSVNRLTRSVGNLRREVTTLSEALASLKSRPGEAAEPEPQRPATQRTVSKTASEPVRQSEPIVPPGAPYRAQGFGDDQDKAVTETPDATKVAPTWPKPEAVKPATPKPPRKPLLAPGWEQRLAERWLVWLGGVAMALGGLFLVIYAADRGWLSPALRCVVGVLAGLALAAAGEWLRRRPGQLAIAALHADYVPQAFSAAGLFIAFTSIYLAYGYFAILPSGVTFVLLAAVSFAGFGLALLQGPYVAALGLAGAMLTPALVSTGSHNAWGLFIYLLAITAAAIAVLLYRKWWWLGFSAIGFGVLWFLSWVLWVDAAGDWIPLCVFVFAVAAGFAWLSERRTVPELLDLDSVNGWYGPHGLAATAGAAGMFLLAALFALSDYLAAAGWALAAGAALIIALVYYRPRFAVLFPVSALICTLAVVTWPVGVLDLYAMLHGFQPSPLPNMADIAHEHGRYVVIAALFSVIFLAGGYLCLKRVARPLWLVGASLLVPLALMLSVNTLFWFFTTKSVLALTATAIAGLSACATWQLLPSIGAQKYKECAGMYVMACGIFLYAAMAFVTDAAVLTVGMALLVLAISYIWDLVPFRLLRHFTLALATVVLVRLSFNPYIFDYPATDWFGQQWVLYGFGISAAAFFFAAQKFRKSADDELVTALESGALVFAVLLVTYEVRIFIEGSISARTYGFLEQSVQSVSWLTSAYGLMLRNAKAPRFYTKWGARGLLTLASAQVLFLQVLYNNPAITGDTIRGFFPADSLFLAYAAPAVLLCLIVPKLPAIGFEKIRRHTAGFIAVLLLVYVTLEIRQLFQGRSIYLLHDTNLELYVTTLAWFGLAGALAHWKWFNLQQVLQPLAKWVGALAVLTVFAGHIGIFNPVLTDLAVPGTVVFNILLLGYAAPAIGLALIARQSEGTVLERYRDHLGVAAYVIGFAYVTLEVRRLFQGPFMHAGAVGDAEYYGYSLIWLVYALAALGVGMWLKRSIIRHAALAVLVLVVLKVFLSDMAGLGGLYRVASFMGLGLSLVGIGYLYQRYVFPVKDNANGKPA